MRNHKVEALETEVVASNISAVPGCRGYQRRTTEMDKGKPQPKSAPQPAPTGKGKPQPTKGGKGGKGG